MQQSEKMLSLPTAEQQSRDAPIFILLMTLGSSVAEWLACWTQAQKGLGSNRSRDVVG